MMEQAFCRGFSARYAALFSLRPFRTGVQKMVIAGRLAAGLLVLVLAGCGGGAPLPTPASSTLPSEYRIGPSDSLQIMVWHNPDLSLTVPVRPDGRISVPLVQDVYALGKTPMELAAEVQQKLKQFVSDPQVTVIVEGFAGPFEQQVRVIGEAAKPQALPYRANMTLLDLVIEAGGLTKFAAGNRAVIVRTINGEQHTYNVHLDSLINDGEIKYNAPVEPGDILIIPQTYF